MVWRSLDEQVDALIHVRLPKQSPNEHFIVISTSHLEGNDWRSTIRLLRLDLTMAATAAALEHVHANRLPTTIGSLSWSFEMNLLCCAGDDGDIYFCTFDNISSSTTSFESDWKCRVVVPNAASILGHDDLITSVDILHSLRSGVTLASSSWDRSVKIWNVETMSLTDRLNGHMDKIWSVQWSPHAAAAGSVLASASQDCTGMMILSLEIHRTTPHLLMTFGPSEIVSTRARI